MSTEQLILDRYNRVLTEDEVFKDPIFNKYPDFRIKDADLKFYLKEEEKYLNLFENLFIRSTNVFLHNKEFGSLKDQIMDYSKCIDKNEIDNFIEVISKLENTNYQLRTIDELFIFLKLCLREVSYSDFVFDNVILSGSFEMTFIVKTDLDYLEEFKPLVYRFGLYLRNVNYELNQ